MLPNFNEKTVKSVASSQQKAAVTNTLSPLLFFHC